MMRGNYDNMSTNYSMLLESEHVQFDFNFWSHFSLLILCSLKKLRGSLPFILIKITFLLKLSLTNKFIFTLITLSVMMYIRYSSFAHYLIFMLVLILLLYFLITFLSLCRCFHVSPLIGIQCFSSYRNWSFHFSSSIGIQVIKHL